MRYAVEPDLDLLLHACPGRTLLGQLAEPRTEGIGQAGKGLHQRRHLIEHHTQERADGGKDAHHGQQQQRDSQGPLDTVAFQPLQDRVNQVGDQVGRQRRDQYRS